MIGLLTALPRTPLYQRLLEDRRIADRVRNKARYLRDPVRQSQYGLVEGLGILARLMMRGMVAGGLSRLFHFLRRLPLASPRSLPQAVTWSDGLASFGPRTTSPYRL